MTILDRPIAASFPSGESIAAPDCVHADLGSDLASESNAIAQKHSSDPDLTYNCPVSNFGSHPVNETTHQAVWNPKPG